MKLNKNNYYSQKANIEFMSYSQFKDFCECPAMAMAKIKGEYITRNQAIVCLLAVMLTLF